MFQEFVKRVEKYITALFYLRKLWLNGFIYLKKKRLKVKVAAEGLKAVMIL